MRVKNTTQRFQVFVRDLQESFWGDFQGRTREMLKKLLETDAEQQMADYLGLKWHERAKPAQRVDYRNGFYERDYVTPLGVIRLRIPRTRQCSFLPRWIGRLQRRAPEVAELIRQAFLRGISTRQVGRVVAVLTGDRGIGQCADRLAVDARAGPCGARFSPSAAGGSLVLSGFGWRVVEGAARLWAAARAVVGGLRDSPRWPSGAAGLYARQERKPSRVGGIAQRSVPARAARRELAVGDH